MKVHFNWGVKGFSGYKDRAVFYYTERLGQGYMRSFTYPSRNPSAERTKLVMANLKLIQPSQDYRLNFFDYMLAYNDLRDLCKRPMLCWNNLYIRMLYAMQKSTPGIDLATLTREDIYEQNLPCISVKSAIEAGLLPEVKNYQRFNKLI